MEIKTAEQFLLQKYFALEEENERLKDQLLDMERQIDEVENANIKCVCEPVELCSVKHDYDTGEDIVSVDTYQVRIFANGSEWAVGFHYAGCDYAWAEIKKVFPDKEPAYCEALYPMHRMDDLQSLVEGLNSDE